MEKMLNKNYILQYDISVANECKMKLKNLY